MENLLYAVVDLFKKLDRALHKEKYRHAEDVKAVWAAYEKSRAAV